MREINIAIGDIIEEKTSDKRYRFITLCHDSMILCEMDTSKFNLLQQSYQNVLGLLYNGTLTVVKDEPIIFEPECLPDKMKEDYWNKQKMMNEVLDAYGPDYLALCGRKQKPELEAILEKYSMSKRVFWHICTRYFQSGMQVYTLADSRAYGHNKGMEYAQKKKSGRRPDYFTQIGIPIEDKAKQYMDEALDYYLKGRVRTLYDAFTYMNSLHYHIEGSTDLLPESRRPTKKQFYYYASKHLTRENVAAAKTSQREVRNDERILTSDSQDGVFGPGDMVEIDACEVDASIVSMLDIDQSVGRPTVYVMSDIATRVILAVSPAFDVNSDRGLFNLFLNLYDDKQEYCRRYGVEFDDPRLWPSNIIPRCVRCDQGSDFMSSRFRDFCIANKIDRQIVPAATGSMKGVIEQEFHQMNMKISPHLEGFGYISKRYDSEHHAEAVLTIEGYTQMLINFVLNHNQHAMENYPMTKDMIQKDVSPIPALLWQYGIDKYGPPEPIQNPENYLFSLMKPVKAKITRRGITYDGLVYKPYNDPVLEEEMFRAGKKGVPFQARIDERCIDALYYVRDGKLYRAPLNDRIQGNTDYQYATLYTWNQYRKLVGDKKAHDRIQNEDEDASYFVVQQLTVQNATSKKTNYSSDKNMRPARTIEKERTAAENRIEQRLPEDMMDDSSALPDKESMPAQIPEESEAVHRENIEDAFNNFDDDDF